MHTHTWARLLPPLRIPDLAAPHVVDFNTPRSDSECTAIDTGTHQSLPKQWDSVTCRSRRDVNNELEHKLIGSSSLRATTRPGAAE
jgi:hypothetical protein